MKLTASESNFDTCAFNNNIGCIETSEEAQKLRDFNSFNNNIGCIETKACGDNKDVFKLFNNNIGCIETGARLCYWIVLCCLITT